MLIKLRDMYREITSNVEPAAAITLVTDHGAAANADNIQKAIAQTRRQRRQRRTKQSGLHNVSGWTVRCW